MIRSITCGCGASISLNDEPTQCPACGREVADKDRWRADRESGPALQRKYRRHLPIASIVVAPILLAFLLPAAWITYERAQEPVVQTRSQENLRQIAQAMLKYNDDNGRLPPAVV